MYKTENQMFIVDVFVMIFKKTYIYNIYKMLKKCWAAMISFNIDKTLIKPVI